KSFAAVQCDSLSRCDPLYFKQYYGDTTICGTKLETEYDAQLKTTGTTLTQSQVDACTAKVAQLPCDGDRSTITECQFKGSLALNAPCFTAAQCQSGACFKKAVGDILEDCGVCMVPVGAGAECTNAPCQYGLVCVRNNNVGKCTAFGPIGAPCAP